MRRLSLLLALLFLAMPAIALACPVCGTAAEESKQAFFSMTIFMSLLPLGLIGGMVGFLWYRARQLQVPASDPVPPAPAK